MQIEIENSRDAFICNAAVKIYSSGLTLSGEQPSVEWAVNTAKKLADEIEKQDAATWDN